MLFALFLSVKLVRLEEDNTGINAKNNLFQLCFAGRQRYAGNFFLTINKHQ